MGKESDSFCLILEWDKLMVEEGRHCLRGVRYVELRTSINPDLDFESSHANSSKTSLYPNSPTRASPILFNTRPLTVVSAHLSSVGVPLRCLLPRHSIELTEETFLY